MTLDDARRDPSISPSLLKELTAYHAKHGEIPPPRQWDIIFGPELMPRVENRWMLM